MCELGSFWQWCHLYVKNAKDKTFTFLVQRCGVNVPKEWHKYPDTFWGHHMEDIPPHSLCFNQSGTRPPSQTSQHTHYQLFQGWTGTGRSVFSLCTHTLGQLAPSVQRVCGLSYLHEGKLGLSTGSSIISSVNMLIQEQANTNPFSTYSNGLAPCAHTAN